MIHPIPRSLPCAVGMIVFLLATTPIQAQQTNANPNTLTAELQNTTAVDEDDTALSSTEQGHVQLPESFELDRRTWRLQKRREALEATQFKFQLRTYYFNREKFDGSRSESMAIGGWAGFKTGYFLDHIAFGVTGYTSQHLFGGEKNDGAQILKTGQDGYTVLGEAYVDVHFTDDLDLYIGRKEYDTPYINRDDSRMTPKTFEAIAFQGKIALGDTDESLRYGGGYFSRIKERNSDRFIPMSEDAGATVDRGVYTAGALYKRGDFSFGTIDYYSPDIINIAYAEAKISFKVSQDLKPTLALQFSDQRSTGDDLLKGSSFSAHQFGIKAELPWRDALFTAAFTQTAGNTNMQSPWGGYPGYTSVQVEDFNRDGEGAFLLRAGYNLPFLKGLSSYALWVHGTNPDGEGQFRKDEVDLNLQYAPTEGLLKGLSLRVRYAVVDQHGGDVKNNVSDFRVIASYSVNF